MGATKKREKTRPHSRGGNRRSGSRDIVSGRRCSEIKWFTRRAGRFSLAGGIFTPNTEVMQDAGQQSAEKLHSTIIGYLGTRCFAWDFLERIPDTALSANSDHFWNSRRSLCGPLNGPNTTKTESTFFCYQIQETKSLSSTCSYTRTLSFSPLQRVRILLLSLHPPEVVFAPVSSGSGRQADEHMSFCNFVHTRWEKRNGLGHGFTGVMFMC